MSEQFWPVAENRLRKPVLVITTTISYVDIVVGVCTIKGLTIDALIWRYLSKVW